MDHDTGERCGICLGSGQISDEWTDAVKMAEMYRESRARQLADLAADIDPGVLEGYDRMVWNYNYERRKEIPR